MLNPRSAASAIGMCSRNRQNAAHHFRGSILPGDKVVVLDMFGTLTGIQCTVQKVEAYSVGGIWGGDTITTGRSWLMKVSCWQAVCGLQP